MGLTSKDLAPRSSYGELTTKQKQVVDMRVRFPQKPQTTIAALAECDKSYVSAIERAYAHIIEAEQKRYNGQDAASQVAMLLDNAEPEGDISVRAGNDDQGMIDVSQVAEAYYRLGWQEAIENAIEVVEDE
jgi:hypothetical protein